MLFFIPLYILMTGMHLLMAGGLAVILDREEKGHKHVHLVLNIFSTLSTRHNIY